MLLAEETETEFMVPSPAGESATESTSPGEEQEEPAAES